MKLIKNIEVYAPEKLGVKDVFMAGGKIVKVADSIELPAALEVEVIDGTGKILLPGFIDCHVHIWDEWVDENNTIGKAYGYQIAKFNQIDKLIETLKTNPQDRRMIMSMWNIEDLPEMTLQPCCYQTLWDVTDGYLNCMLIQRSNERH